MVSSERVAVDPICLLGGRNVSGKYVGYRCAYRKVGRGVELHHLIVQGLAVYDAAMKPLQGDTLHGLLT